MLNRVQVINDLVDWNKLATLQKQFFLNAFKLDSQELEVFRKGSMTPDAFYAGLAMPWLYPPTSATQATAPLYTEGASHDPSGIEAVLENKQPELTKMDSIIVLDTSPRSVDGPGEHPRSPRACDHGPHRDPRGERRRALCAPRFVFNQTVPTYPKIYRLPFEIPQWQLGKVLEWSYSNAVTLWDVGYRAALKFSDDMKAVGGPARGRPVLRYPHGGLTGGGLPQVVRRRVQPYGQRQGAAAGEIATRGRPVPSRRRPLRGRISSGSSSPSWSCTRRSSTVPAGTRRSRMPPSRHSCRRCSLSFAYSGRSVGRS